MNIIQIFNRYSVLSKLLEFSHKTNKDLLNEETGQHGDYICSHYGSFLLLLCSVGSNLFKIKRSLLRLKAFPHD